MEHVVIKLNVAISQQNTIYSKKMPYASAKDD